jgi:hypothetical protein
MALSELQKQILKIIAGNRSESSYMAGGAVLNRDWQRLSDDFDIFHDTDEEIGEAADADIKAITQSGLKATVDIKIYGLVESTITNGKESTILQWMSETKRRFFPLVRDDVWGTRLHQADLAVNKVLAATSRSKARDFVDLLAIEQSYCRLAPLIIAAAGKPPHLSPKRSTDEINRRINGIWSEEFNAVRNLPKEWTADYIRRGLIDALETAACDIDFSLSSSLGCLGIDQNSIPTLLRCDDDNLGLQLRRATEEPEVIPSFKDIPQFVDREGEQSQLSSPHRVLKINLTPP